jgi:WD40 repeat protein
MNEIASCPDLATMRSLLEAQLPADKEGSLLAHLDTCESCQQSLEVIVSNDAAWRERAARMKQERPDQGTALRQAIEHLKQEPHADSLGSGSPLADELTLDFLDAADSADHIGKIGQYEVTEVIGRGGMGVVLKAFDPPLNRFVAIKVLAPQLATSAAARKRFAREAQAAAAISHEHVVAIHGVDEVRGLPYIVMAYVPGRSLQERIDQSGPLELVPMLRIGTQTAAGLAAAHAQGLIHRDVKPANILLEDDVDRVKITDFGLARAADDASLTQSGVVAGTPEYMSPEQAAGIPVDHRSDLFSLASVLYAMCTGRPPFRADTAMAVLRRVCDDQPHPVSELNPTLPDWLAAIIDKLHCKDAAERFQSAADVADLLGQCLAHLQQPRAVPLPRAAQELARLRARDRTKSFRRGWAIAAATLLLMLGGLGVTEAMGVTKLTGVLGQVIRVVTPRGTLVIVAEDPSIDVTVDGENVRIDGTGLGQLTLRPGNHQVQATKDGSLLYNQPIAISRGGRLIVKVTLEPIGQLSASEPLKESSQDTLQILDDSAGDVLKYRVQAGDTLANIAQRILGRPSLWNEIYELNKDRLSDTKQLVVGQELRLPKPKRKSSGLHASGTGFTTDSAHITDLPVFPLATHRDLGSRVAFSPNSQLLVATSDSEVKIVQVDTGSVKAVLSDAGAAAFTSVAVSPTASTVATGSQNGAIRLWDLDTGQLRARLGRHSQAVWGLSFSPDGKTLASGSADRTVKLWDLGQVPDPGRELMGTSEPTERATLWHSATVWSVQFSPTGQYLATADADGVMRLWEAATGKATHNVRADDVSVDSLAVSPDAKFVATGGRNKSIQLWDVGSPRMARSIAGPQAKREGTGLPPKDDEGFGSLRHADDVVHSGPPLAGAVLCLTFGPDGKFLVSGGSDGLVKLWDVATGAPLATLTGMETIVRSVAISPDGRTLAVAADDRKVIIYGRPEADPSSGGLAGNQFKLANPFSHFVDFGGILRTQPDILHPTECQAWADRGRVAFYATDEKGNVIEQNRDNKLFREEVVREQRWVIVTALFPHDEQRARFRQALHSASEEPDYAMLRVERCERLADGSYSDWASVDFVQLAKTVRLLATRWQTEKSDLRGANAIFRGLVMRLPELVEGEWLHSDRDEALDAARKALSKRAAESTTPPPTDAEALEDAVSTLFSNPQTPKKTGQAAGATTGTDSRTMAGMGMRAGMAMPARVPTCTAERVLVRFIDFTVEPERTYQYRLKVVVKNPNYNRLDVQKQDLAKDAVLDSCDWSDATRDIRVPADSAPSAALEAKATFFGIEAAGNKIVYIIDRSGSMTQRGALDAAKRELLASLRKLPPDAQFQVIFYNLRPDLLRTEATVRRLLPATAAHRQLAEQFVASITADGGTEHLPALYLALELRPDVIFFLTDADNIRQRDLEEIGEMNKDRARIHAIRFGIGPEAEETNLLRELSRAHGGMYRYVDTSSFGKE